MSNIFKLAYIPTDEDYFTACLEYLMNSNHHLGQSYADRLLKQAGIQSSKFIQASDHPKLCNENKPDFLLSCRDFDILIEHKLESPLGSLQLERYLELASLQDKTTYLALISNSPQSISSEVKHSSLYIHPRQFFHFYWRDLYPVFGESSDKLTQEFADLMRWFGMDAIPLEGFWEDLFTNPAKGELYRAICKSALSSYFKEVGAKRCALDGPSRATRFGYNVSYPTSWMHLLFISLDSCINFDSFESGSDLRPPYIRAHIWIPYENPHLHDFQGLYEEIISPKNLKIAVHGLENPGSALWVVQDTTPMCVAIYYAELTRILSPDEYVTQQNILDFAETVFLHTQNVAGE